MDLLERCNDVYNRLLLDGDDDDDKRDDLLFNDGIYLLPPITDHDATLPFLVDGIPERCEDGTRNGYWERWPELRSVSCQLFLGVSDSAAAAVEGNGRCADGVRQINVAIQVAVAVWTCLPLPVKIDSDYERVTARGSSHKKAASYYVAVSTGIAFCLAECWQTEGASWNGLGPCWTYNQTRPARLAWQKCQKGTRGIALCRLACPHPLSQAASA